MLGSPLCADDDFIGSMEELQDISESMGNSALSSLDVPEYQYSSNGSEGSAVLGEESLTVVELKNTVYLGHQDMMR